MRIRRNIRVLLRPAHGSRDILNMHERALLIVKILLLCCACAAVAAGVIYVLQAWL